MLVPPFFIVVVLPGWKNEAIENVAGQVLLHVILRIVLQDLPHVADRHQGNFCEAGDGIVYPHREQHGFYFSATQRLGDILQVFGQQIDGDGFFKNGRVEHSVAGENITVPPALHVHRFGGAAAEVHSDNLIAAFWF